MLTEKGYNAVIENLRDKVGDLVSENNTLRAELHKAKQEAARFEDAYVEVYKKLLKAQERLIIYAMRTNGQAGNLPVFHYHYKRIHQNAVQQDYPDEHLQIAAVILPSPP